MRPVVAEKEKGRTLLRCGSVSHARERNNATTSPLLAFLCALALALGLAAPAGADGDPSERFDLVVIDAGHGGEDRGARGLAGVLEKELVLDVAQRLAARLRAAGLRVVMTRDGDETVSLEQRTAAANAARADLFLSIHANSAPASAARGVETYFCSLEASDDEARQVAARENLAFGELEQAAAEGDPLVAILGDLVNTEHLVESQDFARLAQTELAAELRAPSRGVKQAPFVVLMGAQMPASLVEIGFVTNPREARALAGDARRGQIADGLARAVLAFGRRYDAKRGVGPERATAAGGGE
jgi:N-acetylmuramoyl-L-alanine amidase